MLHPFIPRHLSGHHWASSPQVNHLRCLHEFVESQTTYYAQCYRHMLDLQKQLGRCPLGSPGLPGPLCSVTFPRARTSSQTQKAPHTGGLEGCRLRPALPGTLFAGPSHPSLDDSEVVGLGDL